jgi:AcrR family transcriptional regulator
MKIKPYHHGDLRTVMIEKGIEFIDENGAKNLSLRKIAAACGVSHAAPYSHFANKDKLLFAIEKHITDKFAAVLKESVKETGETPEGLFRMCCAYVLFFARNPEYFRFIFIHSNIEVGGDTDEYEPYDLFTDFLKKLFDNIDYPKELRQKTFYAQWAMIHGLAYLAVMSDAHEDIRDWEDKVADILSNNYLITR